MNLGSLADDAGFLLSRASGLVVRGANAVLAEHGLRVRQYSVLSLAVDAADGISQRDLAGALGLDPSQVVGLVDELQAAGLVDRRPSPGDRRTRLVVATARGCEVRAAAAEGARADVRRQLGALTGAEQETLRALLARVVTEAGSRGD
ncbi:MarR family winged helix-turn-helix transcriptional regulator [Geodermatophilus nigrescens]|uniref:DNA-binding transcriptional regulator, MarR family n=1 Tax=Geodermatophilus nigrescens TaxID=1070870 RepID=A0A1M5HJ69_9ACTN|nr:MarR family winged helix-turn-helix transcriptional regulator [Geodermatophilus nigrescens]SHG16019.1 DNA-binding transcriptional regulator, MarR family [Geodermatophilus nigrescens]